MLQTNFLSGGGSKGDGVNLLTDSKKENLITRAFMIKTSDIFKDYIGEPVCISFDAKINSAGTSRVLNLYAYQNSGLSISNGNDDGFDFIPTEEYQRFSFRSTVKNWGIQNPEFSKGEIIIYDYAGDNNISIKNIKIEIGNAATPWTPAPEDIATHTDVEQAVGSENLLIDSKSLKPTANNTAVVNIVENVVVSEWGATDAIRAYGTSGETSVIAAVIGTGKQNVNGRKYTSSIYVKNNSSTDILTVTNNGIGGEEIINANNWKRVVLNGTGSGTKFLQFNFVTPGVKKPFDFTIWKPKIEEGIVSYPIYTPAPRDQLFAALDPLPEAHRNNFRGKNLGTVFTDEQKAAIADGSFHDLWVGDYWIINDHTWRIVDINYWYNKGDTNCTTPHIVVMPDAILYTHNMNATDVTDKWYQGSLMYTEGLDRAKTIVNTDFGEACVLNNRIILTNASESGHASGGGWANSTVEIPNEIMMYGCLVFSAMNNGTAVPYLYTTEYTQLALFRLVPRFINASRQWFWLRDIVSGAHFADVGSYGHAAYASASDVGGVRPVVGITGGTVSADEPDDDLEVTELSGKGGDPL